MELFIWLYAFDKRTLCGLNYGKKGIVYIWLIPAIIAMTVLCLSWFDKLMTNQTVMHQCLHTVGDNLKQQSHNLVALMAV